MNCNITKKSRKAETLIETLTALVIAGLILPAVLDSVLMAVKAQMHIYRMENYIYASNWWFNRLEYPVTEAALEAMPVNLPCGKFRFDWVSERGIYGDLRVTLTVYCVITNAQFVALRVF